MRVCPVCDGDREDPSVPCPACGNGPMAAAEAPPIRPAQPISWGRPLLWGCGVVGLLALLAAIAIPGLSGAQRASSERNAAASLKTLATAEADFRANDRDGNRVSDFWTGDVAGLYCISPDGGHPFSAIKLIELSIALADGDPLRPPGGPYQISNRHFGPPSPKAGTWYWALRADASQSPPAPYRIDTGGERPAGAYYNGVAFGFLAYPDSLSASKWVFAVNEGNTIIRRRIDRSIRPGDRTPPGPVADHAFHDWPGDAVRQRDWERPD